MATSEQVPRPIMSILIMAVILDNLAKVENTTARLSQSRADEDGKEEMPRTRTDGVAHEAKEPGYVASSDVYNKLDSMAAQVVPSTQPIFFNFCQ
jgi:hypothetical protein